MTDSEPDFSMAAEVVSNWERSVSRQDFGPDGWIVYIGQFAQQHLSEPDLSAIASEIDSGAQWVQRDGVFGHKQPRLTAAYGEPGVTYRYSNINNTALPWLPEIVLLKTIIGREVPDAFNYCLLNKYRDGQDGVSWHSDDERGLVGPIASMSLGATRTFIVKHKITKAKHEFALGHGDLLVMGGDFQNSWLHSVPKSKETCGPRINLTFRRIAE